MESEPRPGQVTIAGAGPGDPGLLTVAAARAIAAADVIVYDALAPAAVLRGARPGAELLFAGKRGDCPGMAQREIEQTLIERAKRGLRVLRLKGGDPFVFGRGGEEALACQAAGIPFTVIPGISSAIAAPAYAGIPLTLRGVSASFMVVTAAGEDGGDPAVDWGAAACAGTLVVLMGAASLLETVARLRSAGAAAATPAACIRWGTRHDQQVVTGSLADIAERASEAGLTAPVVTVVGEVARLADRLAWFQPGTLAGRRVVVTRARAQASALANRLEALGAEVIEAPSISIRSLAGEPVLRELVRRDWDWVLLTSKNAVDSFCDALVGSGGDLRSLHGTRLAVLGAATEAALEARGMRANFVPSAASTRDLAREAPIAAGERVLVPASSAAGGELAAAVAARGADVHHAIAYDNVPAVLDEATLRAVVEADAITFTSTSTAANLKQALGQRELNAGAKLVSIGPQTSAAVVAAFGRLDAEAAAPDLDTLVEAVVKVLRWDS